MTINFFHLSLLLLFLVPGSGIQDPGWIKIRIRDPGCLSRIPDPATLATSMSTWKGPPFYISVGLQLHIHHGRQVYETAGVHTTEGHFSHTSYAHSFVATWVSRFGVPECIIMSDRGTKFTSAISSILCEWTCPTDSLKVHKRENFLGSDFETCTFS